LERAARIELATSAWKAEALPLCNARDLVWWAGLDSNQRSAFARRVYSPVPLTTRPPTLDCSRCRVAVFALSPDRPFQRSLGTTGGGSTASATLLVTRATLVPIAMPLEEADACVRSISPTAPAGYACSLPGCRRAVGVVQAWRPAYCLRTGGKGAGLGSPPARNAPGVAECPSSRCSHRTVHPVVLGIERSASFGTQRFHQKGTPMKRTLLGLVAAAALVTTGLSPVLAAPGAAAPAGPYQKSCAYARVAAGTLTAACRGAAGLVKSSIVLSSCASPGVIANTAGTLTCTGAKAMAPAPTKT